MNYTKCTGTRMAIEYNENYVQNAKLACYCPYCCLVEEREPTPYKIIRTEDGYIEIFDESESGIKDKNYEVIPTSNNPHDPWGCNHCNPNEIIHTYSIKNIEYNNDDEIIDDEL